MAKVKQSFDDIGKALDSGNVSDAKAAFDKLQSSLPAQARNDKNPLSEKINTLSKALDSGDAKAAQEAFADLKKTAAQRPAGGAGRAGHPQGPPPGGAPPGGGAEKSTSTSSNSNKIYDKKDANKDGKVTYQEEQDYKLKHPEAAIKTTPSAKAANEDKIDSDRGIIDASA